MELFNSQEILDDSSVPRERDQARAGWVEGIFDNVSSLEVPTDLLLEWLHKESTRIPNYMLQTKQVGVHTALESHNCATTSDQSSITTKYVSLKENTPANTTTKCGVIRQSRPRIIFNTYTLVRAAEGGQRDEV